MPSLAPSNRFFSVWLLLLPVMASIALYRLSSFDPAPLPGHALALPSLKAPLLNNRILSGAEFVGVGRLDKPEDIAYHPESGLIYTGCADGWVKRVMLNHSAVEDWVNTGGRPLGIAFGRQGEVIVADAQKGLLSISKEGRKVEVLTDEAEGVRFKLTDGVDIAEDGVVYFTDASYKYSLEDYALDLLEGKPHGRLLSYNPSNKTTRVLLHHLYFANGVVVSPRQDHLVFCESLLRRCSKYYIEGEKRGIVETFVEGLPGFPDNIRYGAHGHYWVALFSGFTTPWYLLLKYPFLRKITAFTTKYSFKHSLGKNAGVFQLDFDGNPIAHYLDPSLSGISSGVEIGNHLYCGTVVYSHITRLNLQQHPARPAASA